jgi:hypothetical protein
MDTWERLGGRLASVPAVTTWAPNEMQLFAIWDDGQLWDSYWDGAAWHEWHPHGGSLVGNPAACSWGPDRIDVFARGADGALWHRWYEPAGWQPWERIPRPHRRLRARDRWRRGARLVGRIGLVARGRLIDRGAPRVLPA